MMREILDWSMTAGEWAAMIAAFVFFTRWRRHHKPSQLYTTGAAIYAFMLLSTVSSAIEPPRDRVHNILLICSVIWLVVLLPLLIWAIRRDIKKEKTVR